MGNVSAVDRGCEDEDEDDEGGASALVRPNMLADADEAARGEYSGPNRGEIGGDVGKRAEADEVDRPCGRGDETTGCGSRTGTLV